MRPSPGHKAAVAVWHTIAEAVLQQVLQLVSWKTSISRKFNVNMPVFNCLETLEQTLIWQQLPFEQGPVPLHHHWRVSALPGTFSDLYQGKGRSCVSHLVQIHGHILWEGLEPWAFLNILLSPLLVTLVDVVAKEAWTSKTSIQEHVMVHLPESIVTTHLGQTVSQAALS